LNAVVTYQDSCHLAHAQRQTRAPRAVLESIPGLRLEAMPFSDRCCGAAGVYSFTQPEMSLVLLRTKMRDVRKVDPDFIATSNPGCMAQLEAGVRRYKSKARVVHAIELLDHAYRAS
jgi:Fe-S oxidoreductase